MQMEIKQTSAPRREDAPAHPSEESRSVSAIYEDWRQSLVRREALSKAVDELAERNPDPRPPRKLAVRKTDADLMRLVYSPKECEPGDGPLQRHWPSRTMRDLADGRAWPAKHASVRDEMKARAQEIVAAHAKWVEECEKHWEAIGLNDLEKQEEAERKVGIRLRTEIAAAPARNMQELVLKIEAMAWCVADNLEDAERELAALADGDDACTDHGLAVSLVRDFYLLRAAGFLTPRHGA